MLWFVIKCDPRGRKRLFKPVRARRAVWIRMSEPRKRVREEDEEEAGEPAKLSPNEPEQPSKPPNHELVDALTSVLATWFDAISAEEPDLAKDPIAAEESAD